MFNYTIEKLSESVHQLAVGEGDAKSRVLAISHYLVRLNKSDFPEGLQQEFSDIMNEITKNGPVMNSIKNEISIGAFENTILNLSNSSAANIAERVFKLYHDIKLFVETH